MSTEKQTQNTVSQAQRNNQFIWDFVGLMVRHLCKKDEFKDQLQKVMEAEINLHKQHNPFYGIMQQFTTLVVQAYPVSSHTDAIHHTLSELNTKEFKSVDELKEDISKFLFRLFFSEGANKVYDFNDRLYYNDALCQQLFDKGIFISEEWVHQLLRCLVLRTPHEDMLLHNITPEWMWKKCFMLMMGIHELTHQTIKHTYHG